VRAVRRRRDRAADLPRRRRRRAGREVRRGAGPDLRRRRAAVRDLRRGRRGPGKKFEDDGWRAFLFNLAAQLHMTVGQLLAGASSRELTEWQGYHLYLSRRGPSGGRKTVKWHDD